MFDFQQPTSPPRQSTSPDETVAGSQGEGSAKSAQNSDSDDRLAASLAALKPGVFSEAHARHLLWRAGFGANAQQITLVAQWGVVAAVEHLIDASKVPSPPVSMSQFDATVMRPPNREERELYRAAQRAQDEDKLAELRKLRQDREQVDRSQMAEIQKWWLARMIESPRPLEEKMTLFWHGHFATNFRTIENSYHMFAQNNLFRTHALGSFRNLLLAIIRDPAMIAYLDNNDSKKGKPNENLARELMELFALGIGNYSERDIKEGARSLTGYTFEDDTFVFQPKSHDSGVKTILGRTGAMNGEDFVETILAQPACAKFIARKLYHFFVADVPSDERGGDASLDPAQRKVIASIASTLRSNNYELKPALRKLFTSEHFYEPLFRNQQIKSPAQLVVGAVRSLNTPTRDLAILNDALDLMGQRLFLPPSVKGWEGGRSWINTSTLFVRQNTLTFLLSGKKPAGFDASASNEVFDSLAVIGEARSNADAAIHRVLRVALGQTPQYAVETLRTYMKSQDDKVTNESVTGMLLLATAMPDYQLC